MDSWFWLLNGDGRFTVKSVYQWLQGTFDSTHIQFWKKFWTLKIPGKVVSFLWRVCKGCLPTLTALAGKQVTVNTSCPWCHTGSESDVHVLFQCDFVKTVWATTGLQNYIRFMPDETCFDVCCRIFSTVSRDQSAMFGMVCWSLWNRRNKWVWDRANGSAFGVKAAALKLLGDWRKAQVIDKGNGCRNDASAKKWSKPPTKWTKWNVDAAIFTDGNIGLGSVCRDSQGRFLRARCGRVSGRWQPREAEALSLKRALIWAKELGMDCCIFETDSMVLVEACKGKQGASYFHTIVSDCVDLCKHFNQVQVSFVCRSANSVAHLLATHSMSDLMEWAVNPPDFINHVHDFDLV